MSAVDDLSYLQRFATFSLMNLKTDSRSTGGSGGGDGGGQEYPSVTVTPFKPSQPKQQTSGIGGHSVSFINNNGHNWQAKDYYVSRVLSSLQPDISSDHYNESRRFISNPHSRGLLRISEELDLETTNDMMFVEHDENSHFQQGSSSSKPQRPQYCGTGLDSASFDEDDDDYEILLDEGLARDGLYRGISVSICIILLANDGFDKATTEIRCCYTQ